MSHAATMSPAWAAALAPRVIRSFADAERDRQMDAFNRVAQARALAAPRDAAEQTPPPAPADYGFTLEDITRALDWQREQTADEAAQFLTEFGTPAADLRREAEIAAEIAHATAADATLADYERIQGARDSAFIAHVKNRAGERVATADFAEARERRAQLEEETIDICLRMASAGRVCLGNGPQAWIVSPLTGDAKPVPNVKPRVFFPTVAAQKRAKVLAALELLLAQKAHRFDKFVTFTGGARVALDTETNGAEVRAAFQRLHRRISKLNEQPFMRKVGARIIFRSSEVGSFLDEKTGLEKRDARGRPTVHPHAHCIIHFPRYIAKADLAEWARALWAWWGAHLDISGALENVREVCKYVIKPAELRRLSGPELAALDDALFRLHRVQPLGELRDGIRARHRHCLTVKRVRRATPHGSRVVPTVMPDWNARRRTRIPSAAEEAAAARRAEHRENLARRVAAQRAGFERIEIAELRADYLTRGTLWTSPPVPDARAHVDAYLTAAQRAARAARPRPAWKNRIVARLAPSAYFRPITEPALLVWSDTRPELGALLAHPVARATAEAARPLVEAAERLGPLVRAAQPPQSQGSHQSRNCPAPKTRTDHLPGILRAENWQQPLAPALA